MGSFGCRHWKQGTPQKNGREIMPLTVATMVCLPNVCRVVPAKIRQIYQIFMAAVPTILLLIKQNATGEPES